MPNIVTHMVIAEQMFPQAGPDFYLGSTLPDFLGMARDLRGSTTSLNQLRENDRLSDGIDFHIATDSVYDQMDESRQLVIRAQKDLGKIGLSKGALRACADAGTEILLDGVVMESGHVPVFINVNSHLIRGASVLDSIDDMELRTLIKEYFEDYRPNKYRDPETVANLLQHRLSMRKSGRLGFDDDKIPAVAEAFAKQQKRLRACAGELIGLTVDKLKARATGN